MKSGAVAVIGRANAGKSTLINVLVGEKISIVSPKPQTTRDTVLGVMTREDYQIVFMDTPGIYKSATLLNSFMQKETADAAKDVDLILYVIDAHDRLSDEEVAAVSKYGKMSPRKQKITLRTTILACLNHILIFRGIQGTVSMPYFQGG